jgi:hypothetical protein
MAFKLNILILVILFFHTSSPIPFQYFPEEITILDQLDNEVSYNEYLLASFYYVDPLSNLSNFDYIYDYRNGIIVYPFNDVKQLKIVRIYYPSNRKANLNNGCYLYSKLLVIPSDIRYWPLLKHKY